MGIAATGNLLHYSTGRVHRVRNDLRGESGSGDSVGGSQ